MAVERYDFHYEKGIYSKDCNCRMIKEPIGDYISYEDYKALADLAKQTMFDEADRCVSCRSFRWENHCPDCEYLKLGIVK